jgi:hypothetical protein
MPRDTLRARFDYTFLAGSLGLTFVYLHFKLHGTVAPT